MMIGYFLSGEQLSPAEQIEQARMAGQAEFEGLWISEHFHPWNDEQGHSPLVWSTIGAPSQVTKLKVTTAVTRPTVRIHPAVIARAARATAQQIGPDQREFFDVYADEVLPEARAATVGGT